MPRTPILNRLLGLLYPFVEQNDVTEGMLVGPAGALAQLDASAEVFYQDGRYLEPGSVTVTAGTNTVTQVADAGGSLIDWTTRFQVGDEIVLGGSTADQSGRYVVATVSSGSLTVQGAAFSTTETGLLYAKATFGLWRRCQELGVYPGGYESDTTLRANVLSRWSEIQSRRGTRSGLTDELSRVTRTAAQVFETGTPLSTLAPSVEYLQGAGLTVLGDYDGKFKVRANGSGLACAWDDRRAATDVGRATFPGNTGSGITCGADYTGLTGQSKCTIGARLIPFNVNANLWVCGRWGTSASSTQQWALEISSGGRWVVQLNNINGGAGITYTWTGANTLTAGALYDAYLLIDLTQATDLAKVSVVYATFDPATQTWSALTTDAGSAVTAGLPATIPAIAPNTQPFQIGRRGVTSSSFQGLIDDVKVWPGVVLTAAQMAAARSDNAADPNWVAPDLWFPFTDFLNHGAAGHAYDGTVAGDVMLCTDDRSAGRTLVSGSTNAPAYDAVNGVVSGDGVSQFMQAVGGQITRIGANDDYALILVGTEPTSGGIRYWGCTGGIAVGNILGCRQNGANLEAISSSRIAGIARTAGVRVVVVRRRSAATDVAIEDGNAAEQLGTAGVASATAPTTLSLFATPSAGSFGNGTLRRILVVQGNISHLQSLATRWGAAFAGATI